MIGNHLINSLEKLMRISKNIKKADISKAQIKNETAKHEAYFLLRIVFIFLIAFIRLLVRFITNMDALVVVFSMKIL